MARSFCWVHSNPHGRNLCAGAETLVMGRYGQVKTLSMLPILCARYLAYLHDFNYFNPDLAVVFHGISRYFTSYFRVQISPLVAQSDDMDQNVGYPGTNQLDKELQLSIAVLNHPEQ